MNTPDPLAVKCPYCRASAGERCGVRGFGTWRASPAVRPHKGRLRAALAMAAHADPALDAFPGLGPVSPCGLCGSGLPQRHRVVDAIAGHLAAGEAPEDLAEEYGVSRRAVRAVALVMARWPGEWW